MNTKNDLDIPLVIDLDGTLIKTDLLYESANHSLTKDPLAAINICKTLPQGRSILKAGLTKNYEPDFNTIPLNQDVIDWAKSEKQRGRKLILATASHEKLAHKAAAFFGFFDQVLATNDARNLKSEVKRDELVRQFGEQGYDYIGDTDADKPVWQSARYAHVVAPTADILAWLRDNNNAQLQQTFHRNEPSNTQAFLHALRPHQWVKNLLIFLPLLTAHLYTDISAILTCLLAFIVFSLTASSVYILNDLVDIENDRQHPRKRKRPFASGTLSILQGWVAWPVLPFFALLISLIALPFNFTLTLFAYYLLTIGYSFFFKRQPILDVILLAGLYTIRIIAGIMALNIDMSFWLLSLSMFIFLSLALMKRASEVKAIIKLDDTQPLRGRGYIGSDFSIISSMGVTSGIVAVVFLALYVQDSSVAKYYTHPELIWLSCPLLLYWIGRAWLITHRGKMNDDPVLFAIKDSISWLIAIGCGILFAIARYIQ